jgi:hypothetical protein
MPAEQKARRNSGRDRESKSAERAPHAGQHVRRKPALPGSAKAKPCGMTSEKGAKINGSMNFNRGASSQRTRSATIAIEF